MNVTERLSALRDIMEKEGLDAYIVSGTDPHNSEYLPDAWKQREWISGFTGSFGVVVVLKDYAGLWTDTRYFIQAEQQLKETEIKLHKLRIPNAVDYPEWLAATLSPNSRVGLDGFCTSVCDLKNLQEKLSPKGIEIVEKSHLIGDIWLDRPALPEGKLFLVPSDVTGRSAQEKVRIVQETLFKNQADYFIFSALDEIAWLYNIRCDDIKYNPVAISYAIVGKDKAWLFVKSSKIPSSMVEILEQENIYIKDYHHLFLFLDEIEKDSCFCMDVNSLNSAIYNKIKSTFSIKEVISPIVFAKSIKTHQEIDGFKKACIKDGVALTKFFYWLESNIDNHLSETMVSDKLTEFRTQNEDYVSNSFENISAYGMNAALPHYTATIGSDAFLERKGLYLVDSGGQYTHGTTDITRTIPLGELTALEKEDYTIVLKGMIALSRSVFPKGTRGCNIDAIARQPLWQALRNFGHGTGHGVGFFLNVHEGPQSIRQELKDQALYPGMVSSNEPAVYREGMHGVRHENLLLCVPLETNEFGEWYGFETLTLCYFDTSAILPELLNQDEKDWLNAYHKMVYEQIVPYLTSEEAAWLAEKTQPMI